MKELVRWDPFKAALPFEGSLLELVPSLLRPVIDPRVRQAWAGPKMDVSETENAYELAVELPGVPKESIQVSVYENTVTIGAEMSQPKTEEEANWLLRERSFGKFARNLTLPEAVDQDSSQARYADGVLYLTLQKKRASQVKRLTIH
jgi:HSP20 family protein